MSLMNNKLNNDDENESLQVSTFLTVLSMPKPLRSTPGIVDVVTEHLKQSPLSSFRQTSPHPVLNEKISKSNTPELDLQHHVLLGEFRASPYLGEGSIHSGNLPEHDNFEFTALRKATSLNFITSKFSIIPCMVHLPVHHHILDLCDTLKNIPKKAWILPYIIACCPNSLLETLLNLPFLLESFNYDLATTEKNQAINNSNLTGNTTQDDSDLNGSTLNDKRNFSLSDLRSVNSKSPTLLAGNAPFGNNLGSTNPFKHHGVHSNAIAPATSISTINNNNNNLTLSFQNQNIKFPESWRSLGVVLVSKDPTWNEWEPKIIFLVDTYLIECTNSLQRFKVIGFMQLTNATVKKIKYKTKKISRNSSPDNLLLVDPISKETSWHYAIQITGYTNSYCNTTHTFYMTLQDMSHYSQDAKSTFDTRALDMLLSALMKASILTIEDVYDFPVPNNRDSLLGRGRFNEVRLAKRKRKRNLFYHSIVQSDAFSKNLIDSPIFIFNEDIMIKEHTSTDNDKKFSDSDIPECCAMKIVSKEVFWDRVEHGQERPDALIREVVAQFLIGSQFANSKSLHFTSSSYNLTSEYINNSINSNLNNLYHPNLYYDKTYHLPIVQLLSVFETIDGFTFELQLQQWPDLFDALSEIGPLSEYHVKYIIAQLVEAILLCNKLGFAHRDIKLSNICFPFEQQNKLCLSISELFEKENDYIRIKLTDFGMAGFINRSGKLSGRCGTPGYVAPDILHAGTHENYDINVDMFSIGVVAYTLLCGYEPFAGDNSIELLEANKNVCYEFHSPEWDNISKEAKEFIDFCLYDTAEQRLTPNKAFVHPWLLPCFESSSSSLSSQSNPLKSTFLMSFEQQNSNNMSISTNDKNVEINHKKFTTESKQCILS